MRGFILKTSGQSSDLLGDTMGWTCEECGGENEGGGDECEFCGEERVVEAPEISLTNPHTVQLCHRMRMVQQMDAAVGSGDTQYVQRVLGELALGDARRGIQPWDVGSLGDSASAFLAFVREAPPGLTLSAAGNARLGLELPEPSLEDEAGGGPEVVLGPQEHYRVLSKSQLRAEVGLDSDKVGTLDQGEIIVAVESQTIRAEDGVEIVRLRLDDGAHKGWASVTARKGDHDALLQKISDEELPLALAMAKTDLKKLVEKIWLNYLDSLEKSDKKHATEQQKRAQNKKATTMTKEPYHKRLNAAVELAKQGGFTPDEMKVVHTAYMVEGHLEGGKWCEVQFDPNRAT